MSENTLYALSVAAETMNPNWINFSFNREFITRSTISKCLLKCTDLRDDITLQHYHLWIQVLLDVSVNLIKHALEQLLQYIVLLWLSLVQPRLTTHQKGSVKKTIKTVIIANKKPHPAENWSHYLQTKLRIYKRTKSWVSWYKGLTKPRVFKRWVALSTR